MHPIDQAVARNIVAIVAIICAAAVACSGHDGWGWLLFLAVLAGL